MLVLTRKMGESIVVQDNIEIVILEVKGEQIKIGIEAPKEIKVYRKEIYDLIRMENKEAIKLPDIQQLQDILVQLK